MYISILQNLEFFKGSQNFQPFYKIPFEALPHLPNLLPYPRVFLPGQRHLGLWVAWAVVRGFPKTWKLKQTVKLSRSISTDKTGKLMIQFNWRFIQLLFFLLFASMSSS